MLVLLGFSSLADIIVAIRLGLRTKAGPLRGDNRVGSVTSFTTKSLHKYSISKD